MKKVSIFIICLLLALTFLGCANQKVENQNNDDELANMIKELEINRHKMFDMDISFKEYRANTKDFFSSKYPMEKKPVFIIESKEYTEEDLDNLSEEEINEIKIQIEKLKETMFGEIEKNLVQISKSYEDSTLSFKYVFVKTTREITKFDETLIAYRKYIFHKENDTWKILGVEGEAYSESRLHERVKLKYETYNDQPIDYVFELELAEKQP